MDSMQEKARRYGQIVAQGTGNFDLGNVAMEGFIEGFNEARKWIPLSEQKPEPQTMVLAKIDRGEGKTWVILAKFIPARTVLAEDFFEDYDEDDMDCNEEDGQYYVPETWVECSWFGSDLMFHSEPVIEWKPI